MQLKSLVNVICSLHFLKEQSSWCYSAFGWQHRGTYCVAVCYKTVCGHHGKSASELMSQFTRLCHIIAQRKNFSVLKWIKCVLKVPKLLMNTVCRMCLSLMSVWLQSYKKKQATVGIKSTAGDGYALTWNEVCSYESEWKQVSSSIFQLRLFSYLWLCHWGRSDSVHYINILIDLDWRNIRGSLLCMTFNICRTNFAKFAGQIYNIILSECSLCLCQYVSSGSTIWTSFCLRPAGVSANRQKTYWTCESSLAKSLHRQRVGSHTKTCTHVSIYTFTLTDTVMNCVSGWQLETRALSTVWA